MPKINVYLPDDLAEAVRDTGVPVSAVCQRALEQAVRRLTTIRDAVLGPVDAAALSRRLLPHVTARTVTAIRLGAQRAAAAGASNVGTGDLLHGIVDEGSGLALHVLTALDISPATLPLTSLAEPGGDGPGLRFSTPAGNALELAVKEAIAFGHNHIGTEHVIIGLSAQPDGAAGKALRSAGADPKTLRRAVATAGYAHSRAGVEPQAGASPFSTADVLATADILAAVRAELAPLLERIDRLENRAGQPEAD